MLLATPAPSIEGMPLRRPGMAWNRTYQRIFDCRTSPSFAALIETAHTISRAAFRRRRGGLRGFQRDSDYDSELLEETAGLCSQTDSRLPGRSTYRLRQG